MTIRKAAAYWNRRIALMAVALVCSLATVSPMQAQNRDPAAWAAFKDIWKNVTSYSATVIVFERKGTEVQSSVLDYTFRKPSSAHASAECGGSG
jgi:outer membrane lipoprotein-sorting protein